MTFSAETCITITCREVPESCSSPAAFRFSGKRLVINTETQASDGEIISCVQIDLLKSFPLLYLSYMFSRTCRLLINKLALSICHALNMQDLLLEIKQAARSGALVH
jgi:hypothetical protein